MTNEEIKKEQQKWRINQSKLSLPEPLRRQEEANYRQGYFFVTLNINSKRPILGRVCGTFDATTHTAHDVRVELSDIGRAVEQCWLDIPKYYPSVQLIAYQVMPEHFHGLLYLKGTNYPQSRGIHLGSIIRGFMIGSTHRYWDILGIDWREMKQQTEVGIRDAQWTDSLHMKSLRGPALFVRGYNDVIPFDEQEIEAKIRYIHDNPLRRFIKQNLHDIFSVVRGQFSPNWTIATVRDGLLHDTLLQKHPEELQLTLEAINGQMLHTKHVDTDVLSLDYIGQRDLLSRVHKLPLICHRNDAHLFDMQFAATLQAARDGAVIVSAFISPKEREIMHELIDQQLPIINVCAHGFSDRYKPIGPAFYACAEGRLLQISCWQYHFQKDDKTVSRPECMVMNQLVRLITKTPDDWWKP